MATDTTHEDVRKYVGKAIDNLSVNIKAEATFSNVRIASKVGYVRDSINPSNDISFNELRTTTKSNA